MEKTPLICSFLVASKGNEHISKIDAFAHNCEQMLQILSSLNSSGSGLYSCSQLIVRASAFVTIAACTPQDDQDARQCDFL